MAPLAEQMLSRALTERITRLEGLLKAQAQIISSLSRFAFHHIQDRHDAHMHTDDAPDTIAAKESRRLVGKLNERLSPRDIADVRREDGSRGKRVGREVGRVA